MLAEVVGHDGRYPRDRCLRERGQYDERDADRDEARELCVQAHEHGAEKCEPDGERELIPHVRREVIEGEAREARGSLRQRCERTIGKEHGVCRIAERERPDSQRHRNRGEQDKSQPQTRREACARRVCDGRGKNERA